MSSWTVQTRGCRHPRVGRASPASARSRRRGRVADGSLPDRATVQGVGRGAHLRREEGAGSGADRADPLKHHRSGSRERGFWRCPLGSVLLTTGFRP